MWTTFSCCEEHSIFWATMAARTAAHRRSSSAVDMGLTRRSDSCILGSFGHTSRTSRTSVKRNDHSAVIPGEREARDPGPKYPERSGLGASQLLQGYVGPGSRA